MDYADLTIPVANNPSGTKLVFYHAPMSKMLTIGERPTAPATLAEANVIVTDHTFTAPDGFVKVELEVNKNNVADESMGAVTGGHKKRTFSGFISGLSDEQMAHLEMIEREKHIVLVPTKDGKLIQLGEKDNGAMITATHDTGVDDGGERGFVITATWYGYRLRYDGTLTLQGAV